MSPIKLSDLSAAQRAEYDAGVAPIAAEYDARCAALGAKYDARCARAFLDAINGPPHPQGTTIEEPR